jgi:nodulation protein E
MIAGSHDKDDARRVVITGMGAISAIGQNAQSHWQSLADGHSGIGPLQHADAAKLRVRVAAQVRDFDPAAHFDERTLPLLDRISQFALVAARQAVAQAALRIDDTLAPRTAVIVGTGVGGELTHDEQSRRLYAENAQRLHPLSIVRLMINAPASQVSMALGAKGPCFAVASACASSNHAIAQAAAMIQAGLVDVAIVGGTEACLSLGALRAWEAMRVLADDTCRPFCLQRRGLVLGEGAGMFVLESWAHARARNAPALAEIVGCGMSADAGDIVAPSIDGAARAMRAALDDAGIAITEIDHINAHGTATQANDASEARAIHQVFGAHAAHIAVNATKSMHGHALGASGALELVAVVNALRYGIVPPTAHFLDADPACDLDIVHGQARPLAVRVALSNSFAFGGLNAVLAVRRVD